MLVVLELIVHKFNKMDHVFNPILLRIIAIMLLIAIFRKRVKLKVVVIFLVLL
jgi:hypothetical protein